MKRSTCGTMLALTAAGVLVAAPVQAQRYAKPKDLIGVRAAVAERELDAMGYRYKDGYSGNASRHDFWWHNRKDRCIDVKLKDGRVASIRETSAQDCNKKSGSGAGTAVAVVAGAAIIAAIAASAHKPDKDKNAAIADLKGIRASSADSELTARGFTNVDGFKTGETSYTIWYRKASKQCVQMTTADGIATDLRDIPAHDKCK